VIPASIFGRYARALADVVTEKGDEAAIQRVLDTYREIFRSVPALLETFDSPAVQLEAKEKVLAGLMARYPVCATMRNFLQLLLRHHRIRYFAEICDFYTKTVNERKGIAAAQVTVAGPLTEADLSRLRASLVKVTGNRVTLTVGTNPELLAGIVVQIGSTVYDGSVRTQLDEMRRRLASE